MATSSDFTAVRTITEDGLLDHEGFTVDGYTLENFEEYATEAEGTDVAQWFVARTDELLAEYSISGGLTVYPAADVFA